MSQHSERMLDATSMVGIMAGVGMLIPAFFVAEMAFLAVPASAFLISGLLFGTR